MNILTVDGIDVSGCDAYTHNHNELMPYGDVKVIEHYCYHINGNCDGKECDYKQLKRAKAEYDDLHLTYAGCKTANNGLQELNRKLEQENERLKEECTLYDCGNKEWAIEYKKLEDNYTELIDRLDDISYDKSNYYQALQEIRDIILSPEIIDEETKKLHTSEELDNIVRWHREDKLSKIQAKINSVIGAE